MTFDLKRANERRQEQWRREVYEAFVTVFQGMVRDDMGSNPDYIDTTQINEVADILWNRRLELL